MTYALVASFFIGGLYATAIPLAAEEETSATHVRNKIQPYMQALAAKKNNTTDAEKSQVLLGRTLFYEKRLSADLTYSCNSCHDLEKYGTNGDYFLKQKEQGKAFRDIPSIYNLKELSLYGWASDCKKLNEKITHSLASEHEMNVKKTDDLVERLKKISGYESLFKQSFPDKSEAISIENISLALQTFINGLNTPAPIDKFLSGDDQALTEKQRKGAMAFDSIGCFSCHTGSSLGGQFIMKAGVLEPWPNQSDKGYFDVSKNPEHVLTFRVPSLRNVQMTGPYFHDSTSNRLWDAIGKMAKFELGKDLSLEEKDCIQEFLKSLTGEVPIEYIKKPDGF